MSRKSRRCMLRCLRLWVWENRRPRHRIECRQEYWDLAVDPGTPCTLLGIYGFVCNSMGNFTTYVITLQVRRRLKMLFQARSTYASYMVAGLPAEAASVLAGETTRPREPSLSLAHSLRTRPNFVEDTSCGSPGSTYRVTSATFVIRPKAIPT